MGSARPQPPARPRPALHPELLGLQVLVEAGHVFAVAIEQLGRHPLVAAEHALGRLAPARVRHLGIHVGQKPYSLAWMASQKVLGRSSVKLTLTIDLIDLKPYFHGRCRRSGAPIEFTS